MSLTIPFAADELDRRSCATEPGHEVQNAPGTRSGVWECTLRTLKPLSIKAVFEKLAPKGMAYIPGSSIRGMVRNVAEMLGAGCGRYYQDGDDLPSNLKVCDSGGACQVCRIFGFTEGEYSWTSKVRVSDTTRVNTPWIKLGVPNQREALADNGRGWRTFRSYGVRAGGGSSVRCVGMGVEFKFTVNYSNLSDDQFDLLLFALTLRDGEEQLVHKLGYGKSLDLGACLVSVTGDPRPGPGIDKYLNRREYRDFFYRERGQ